MVSEEKETRRFIAQSVDGKVHTVLEYRKVVVFEPRQGPSGEIRGARRLTLRDGRALIEVDAKTFRIAETDEIIRSV